MTKHFKFLLSAFLFGQISFAQFNTKDLLQKSSDYYNMLSNESFQVTRRFKSAINTDTTINHYNGIFQQKGNKKIMKLIFENGDYTLYDHENSFFVYPTKGQVYYNNSKENRSEVRFKEYPYFLSKLFFLELPKKIGKNKAVTNVSTNLYKGFDISITSKDESWFLSLDSNYRIAKFKEIINSSFGVQVKEYLFQVDTFLVDTTNLFDELTGIKKNFQHISSFDQKNNDNKDLFGKTVNIDSLMALLGLIKPYPFYLYFDFFHKSCLPCIKAFPDIIRLRNSFESKKLAVFGIDPIVHDKGDWNNFILRYNINYPVIDGEKAVLVKSFLFNNRHFGYPTSLVISRSGKIVFLQEGYEKNTTKQIIELINSH